MVIVKTMGCKILSLNAEELLNFKRTNVIKYKSFSFFSKFGSKQFFGWNERLLNEIILGKKFMKG